MTAQPLTEREKEKGLADQASPSCCHARGVPLTAKLVGTGCDKPNANLKAFIDRQGLRDHVELLGFRARLDDVFLGASAVASSSAWGEGFQNVLAEAAALGVPVVATDVGEVRVICGDANVVVPPRSLEALAVAIERVLTIPADELLWQAAARRERIRGQYGITTALASFDSAVDELVGSA